MATLNHLETPNRVDEEFWGGVNDIGQSYSVTLVRVSASITGEVRVFRVIFAEISVQKFGSNWLMMFIEKI